MSVFGYNRANRFLFSTTVFTRTAVVRRILNSKTISLMTSRLIFKAFKQRGLALSADATSALESVLSR